MSSRSFVALALVACGTDEAVDRRSEGLVAVSGEPGPAAREVIAVEVRPNGDVVCLKADGGPWSSAEGGHVEIFLRDGPALADWAFAALRWYPPQPPDGALREIVFPGAAFALGVGIGYGAQCVAMPAIDIRDDPGWTGELCVNNSTGAVNVPCFRSGVYDFNLVEGQPPPAGDPPADDPPAPPTQAPPTQAPPQVFDGSGELSAGNCGEGRVGRAGERRCAGMEEREAGIWRFPFECPQGSSWRVHLTTSSGRTTLVVQGESGRRYGESSSRGANDTLFLTSNEADGRCRADVVAHQVSKFKIDIRPWGGSDCHELCVTEGSGVGAAEGCDCAEWCHSACSGCDLPCNIDAPGYSCPFREAEIKQEQACGRYRPDEGNFEHEGTCYRCGDGNQCCYEGGLDNGTGSFDLHPPCSDILGGRCIPDNPGLHCACDVIPLCGCMAQSGDDEGCGRCIGEGDWSWSCNAPGDDAAFCDRARAGDFDWCAIVADPASCLSWQD